MVAVMDAAADDDEQYMSKAQKVAQENQRAHSERLATSIERTRLAATVLLKLSEKSPGAAQIQHRYRQFHTIVGFILGKLDCLQT